MTIHPDKTAWRAVDACGGAYSLEEIHSGWAVGHAFGIADALEAVRPVDALLADMLEALEAAAAYDDAIEMCGNSPERMASFCTAEGDDLDALYARWQSLSRAALAKASA